MEFSERNPCVEKGMMSWHDGEPPIINGSFSSVSHARRVVGTIGRSSAASGWLARGVCATDAPWGREQNCVGVRPTDFLRNQELRTCRMSPRARNFLGVAAK